MVSAYTQCNDQRYLKVKSKLQGTSKRRRGGRVSHRCAIATSLFYPTKSRQNCVFPPCNPCAGWEGSKQLTFKSLAFVFFFRCCSSKNGKSMPRGCTAAMQICPLFSRRCAVVGVCKSKLVSLASSIIFKMGTQYLP